MPTRSAHAQWKGTLKEGKGRLELESGAFEGPYSFGSRFGDGKDTNPEELLGAAHAGCFAMALSMTLGEAGYTADSLDVKAKVKIEQVDGGFAVTSIVLHLDASIPEIDEATFNDLANSAFEGCPISNALSVEKSLQATLK